MSNPRKLSFSLRQSAKVNEVTDSDLPESVIFDYFPVDSDEKIDIVLNVSLNEYVKLATSIDVGRDIAYNDDSLKVWNIWTNAIMRNILDCQDVADCIETSESVQLAITNEYQSTVNQFISDSGLVNPNDGSSSTSTIETRLPTYETAPIAPVPIGCDLDELWAGIRETVERIDLEGRDLLEDLVLINDRAEQIQGLIDLVPLLGDIIADVANFFTQAVPDLLNGYNAYSSPTTLDLIACELFSLVCSECRYPTYDEYLVQFASQSVVGLAFPQQMNYSQIWNAVKAVPALNGSIVWNTINTWQITTMYFGGKWNGSHGKNTLNVWASLGEDLPTDNWIVLCGGCVSPCPIFDFSTDVGYTYTHGYWDVDTGYNVRSTAGVNIVEVEVDMNCSGSNVAFDIKALYGANIQLQNHQFRIWVTDDNNVEVEVTAGMQIVYGMADAWHVASQSFSQRGISKVRIFAQIGTGASILMQTWVDNLVIS